MTERPDARDARAVAGTSASAALPAIAVAPELAGAVRPGVLVFGDLAVRPSAPSGAAAADTLDPRAEARVALVRAMYRRFGIDPTRTRPSSEALWRRVRRGLAWPRINTLVDAGNRCSCETQLPFGLYDLGRVAGRIELRAGAAGDEYAGIGKPVVHLAGRPALFDDSGPFGNPTSDSARTMITTGTRRALVVVYAPPAVPRAELEAVLDLTASRVGEAAGGTEEGRWIASCA